MRAFIGQFDRVSLSVGLLGAAIGAVWLIALDLGMFLASITLVVGSVVLIVHHRWIEIGLLMIGIGLVAVSGYAMFGPPPEPPAAIDPLNAPVPGTVVAEEFAPGMAGLLLIGGVAFTLAIAAWDASEGLRRERLDARHRRRRARQMGDS